MSIKKKILIAALAFGTLAGFGSGFCHLHQMKCGRGGWEGHHRSSPCQRMQNHGWNRGYEAPPPPPGPGSNL